MKMTRLIVIFTLTCSPAILHAKNAAFSSKPSTQQLLDEIKNARMQAATDALKILLVDRATAISEGKQQKADLLNIEIDKLKLEFINITLDYLKSMARSSEGASEQRLADLSIRLDTFLEEKKSAEAVFSSDKTKATKNAVEQDAAANP